MMLLVLLATLFGGCQPERQPPVMHGAALVVYAGGIERACTMPDMASCLKAQAWLSSRADDVTCVSAQAWAVRHSTMPETRCDLEAMENSAGVKARE